MLDAPKGLRRHIAILGRMNAGKSSLVNALARQQVAIVAAHPGTTTDPVEKTMELAPLGPVVLVDTAGMDDAGELGSLRARRSEGIMARSDCAILVADGGQWGETERKIAKSLITAQLPFMVARNKADQGALPPLAEWRKLAGLPATVPVVDISAKAGTGMEALLDGLASLQKPERERPLMADLLPDGGVAVLVVPIDSGAPKGRLILPQVQAIRDCLDGRKICMICTEGELEDAFGKLKDAPDLVVCDSQVVHKVAALTPLDIPLTTFSILMARFKGNLAKFARGAGILERLNPGDCVVIQEACSHHPQEDDIGRVKIPRLLAKKAGGPLKVEIQAGKELADYPEDARVVVHCGACVITRGQMEIRQARAEKASVPMTNYGMAISACQGVLERTLAPFPEALAEWRKAAA